MRELDNGFSVLFQAGGTEAGAVKGTDTEKPTGFEKKPVEEISSSDTGRH